MNNVKVWFIGLLMLFSQFAFAQEGGVLTAADIKLELISQMKENGYLSERMANEVAVKYITDKDKLPIVETVVKQGKSITWEKWLSWTNFFKVLCIILLLIAFSGILKKIIKGMWKFIVAVPEIVYQSVFMVLFGLGIFRPELIWASQYFYIALFSSFALIMVLGWVAQSYPKVMESIAKMFSFGIPVESILSFWGMLYFGSLAWFYESSIFGFFAAVCVSGVFSFTMKYTPGILFLDFKEKMLNAVVFGHLAVLFIYVALFLNMPHLTQYYDIGVQYYCTIALCVGLLVGGSPFYKMSQASGYVLLFIVLFFLSGYGYFFLDLKVIGSIVSCFFILLILEWLGYWSYKSGLIIGCILLGASLYALAMLLEKYGQFFILSLN